LRVGFVVAGLVVVSGAVGLLADAGIIHAFVLRGQRVEDVLTISGRVTTWTEGVQAWARRPIGGYGYYAGHRFGLNITRGVENISTVDSTWVGALVDTWLVGFV